MTLFVNHIAISSSPPSSSTVDESGKKGTQIPPRTLRERRGVTSFIHIKSHTLAVENDDQGLAQPKGHLQPTVMNIPRRRKVPAQAAPISPIAKVRKVFSIRIASILRKRCAFIATARKLSNGDEGSFCLKGNRGGRSGRCHHPTPLSSLLYSLRAVLLRT
ncbi:hypothetical protein C0992_007484 [Termitomyces sp. T32_za158]|nr:hypothetical protein C0992_007484 [Termitomyces sp. T32_za158]